VRPLNLPSRKVFLDVQGEANQRERQRNRLGVFICCLSSERIHYMLVNERRRTMRNRVTTQLIVRSPF
jgi:hypothetical protein